MKLFVPCLLVLVSCLACLHAGSVAGLVPDDGSSTSTGMKERLKERFIDPEDGWVDVSGFLDEPAGFVPYVKRITEPALGNGLIVAPVFIDTNDPTSEGKPVRPNIGLVGAFETDEGSEGYFAYGSAVWHDGRLETKAALVDVSLDLEFYGLGGDLPLPGPGIDKVDYTLEARGGMAEVRHRVGETPVLVGMRYVYAEVDSRFEVAGPIGGVKEADLDSVLSGPTLLVSYDTRNNVFTPTGGNYLEFGASFHEEAFGASSNHQRYEATGIHYRTLRDDLFFGLRGDVQVGAGDTPFYAEPYIKLRGVPALRYQGEVMTSAEAELRWQFWKRFSLVAFGGVGVASNGWGEWDPGDAIFAGGGGFRYELARRYGLHMGIDYGISEEEDAIYVVFGSSWLRP